MSIFFRIYEETCTFAKEFIDKTYDKTKKCVALFVDEDYRVLDYDTNNEICCAERNLFRNGCPQVDCHLVVVRVHKNSHGIFIKSCRPCKKCREDILNLPPNVLSVIWSKEDGFDSSACKNIPKNEYSAQNSANPCLQNVRN